MLPTPNHWAKSFEPTRWIMAADHMSFWIRQVATIRLQWSHERSLISSASRVWTFAISSIKLARTGPAKRQLEKEIGLKVAAFHPKVLVRGRTFGTMISGP